MQNPHATQFAGYTQLSPITLRNRAIGKGKINKGHYPAQKTPYLHGAAMLLKKTIIDKLSLMPEEYFLYYEELDCAPISIGKATNYGTIPLAKYGTRTATPPEKKVR